MTKLAASVVTKRDGVVTTHAVSLHMSRRSDTGCEGPPRARGPDHGKPLSAQRLTITATIGTNRRQTIPARPCRRRWRAVLVAAGHAGRRRAPGEAQGLVREHFRRLAAALRDARGRAAGAMRHRAERRGQDRPTSRCSSSCSPPPTPEQKLLRVVAPLGVLLLRASACGSTARRRLRASCAASRPAASPKVIMDQALRRPALQRRGGEVPCASSRPPRRASGHRGVAERIRRGLPPPLRRRPVRAGERAGDVGARKEGFRTPPPREKVELWPTRNWADETIGPREGGNRRVAHRVSQPARGSRRFSPCRPAAPSPAAEDGSLSGIFGGACGRRRGRPLLEEFVGADIVSCPRPECPGPSGRAGLSWRAVRLEPGPAPPESPSSTSKRECVATLTGQDRIKSVVVRGAPDRPRRSTRDVHRRRCEVVFAHPRRSND